MSERFYINCPLSPGPVELTGAEAHHLAAVCRLKPGDAVVLFNGEGGEYPATVREVGKRHVLLEAIEPLYPQRELPFSLEIMAPIPKGDRAQFLVEKLTELGVTRYVPLMTERSVVTPRDGKMDKLERHVVEASKQCGRNRLMEIGMPMNWADAIARGSAAGEVRAFAHPGCEEAKFQLLEADRQPGTAYRFAVGPEGGFTAKEVEAAVTQGWSPMDLGPRILRIESAAVVLASWAILRR